MDRRATTFLDRCRQWLCDGYHADIRYFVVAGKDGPALFDAKILLTPLPPPKDHRLQLEVTDLIAGQEQLSAIGKEQLLLLLTDAIGGTLSVHGRSFVLPSTEPYRWQRGPLTLAPWSMPLTGHLIGAPANYLERSGMDDGLRATTPPFDGTEDLSNWLGLQLPDGTIAASISVEISPPVDLWFEGSSLSGGFLRLGFHAHPQVDRSRIAVAVRPVPGELADRVHVAGQIEWGKETPGGFIEGRVNVPLPNATGAMVMLLYGTDTVRRHWFLDLSKAPNHRFAAVQQFDQDLRMIRQGLFESQDTTRFELAVAALFFLLGFAPAVQLETNSPDLVVATPGGRLILVECTVRTADIATKIGKLVDRRAALNRSLATSNQTVDISAVLVSRTPRDQIAAHNEALKTQRILLATSETLTEGLLRARIPANPDDLLQEVRQSFVD